MKRSKMAKVHDRKLGDLVLAVGYLENKNGESYERAKKQNIDS